MNAWGFLKTRIGQRFLAIFLSISLLPLVTVGWVGIRSSKTALREQTALALRAASDGAEAQLREFLLNLRTETLDLSHDEDLRAALESTDLGHLTAEPPAVHSVIARLLPRARKRMSELQEVFVLAPDGRVAASSVSQNFGQDLSSRPFVNRGREAYYGGDFFKNPSTGQLTWIIAAPIQAAAAQELLGVLALRIDPSALNALTSGQRVLAEGADTQSFRIGNTGETYLVNQDRLMITPSRYLSNSVLTVHVDTLPVRMAFERGEEISDSYPDYRGTEVNGASVFLREPGWVMVTEIDFSQAFAPVTRLRHLLLAVTGGLGCLIVILAWASTRRITRPIQMLTEADRGLGTGDESAALVPEKGLPNDEIGEFVQQRNARVRALLERRRQLEERTARLNEALTELDQMSYSIMHDMRAPLRAIVGFGQMIAEEDAGHLSPESRQLLTRMRTAASRMDRLICDVLSYSSLLRREMPLYPVNVSELLRGIGETYPELQPSLPRISIPPDLPMVQGNEAALTQCFSNLLSNAVKFTEPGQAPEIHIRGESRSGRVRISVEDKGVGIPKEMRERIFGIFQRCSNSGEGTGMGLAIVRKAAERMGGRVGVESEPGHGSRFWIELPAVNTSDQAAGRHAGAALPHTTALCSS